MTISPCFETIIPFVRQAHNVIGNRTIPDSLKLVRQISNVKMNSNDFHPSVSCNGAAGLSVSSLLKQDLQPTFTQNVRTICGRENCADPCDFPRCTPENLAKTDCMKKKKDADHEPTIYEKYWNRPECCNNECDSAFPRFDDLYYRESDKENRVYTQTWAECPHVVIKPRHICCTEKLNLPPLCKRPRTERPKTACGAVDTPCPPELEGKCPRIRLPCCAAARTTPCKIIKLSSGCKKFNAPSPAFSECQKPKLKRRRVTECWCLAAPSMCQVWSEWRRLQLIKRQ